MLVQAHRFRDQGGGVSTNFQVVLKRSWFVDRVVGRICGKTEEVERVEGAKGAEEAMGAEGDERAEGVKGVERGMKKLVESGSRGLRF